jgi:2-dehydro-3-deoxyphosphogluconate aldolase / (4S)-4-hydroxy-2-oxoglutarate aldolase
VTAWDVLFDSRVLAILRGMAPDNVLERCLIFQAARIRAVEVTIDSPEADRSIEMVREQVPDLTVGAGTVRSLDDLRRALAAGAEFVVTPGTNPGVIEEAHRQRVGVFPGALTPTEIDLALTCGADAVKLFPANSVNPEYLRAVREPFGDFDVIPTGGIDDDAAVEWLRAGASAVAVGSWLSAPTSREVIAQRAARLVEIGADR